MQFHKEFFSEVKVPRGHFNEITKDIINMLAPQASYQMKIKDILTKCKLTKTILSECYHAGAQNHCVILTLEWNSLIL